MTLGCSAPTILRRMYGYFAGEEELLPVSRGGNGYRRLLRAVRTGAQLRRHFLHAGERGLGRGQGRVRPLPHHHAVGNHHRPAVRRQADGDEGSARRAVGGGRAHRRAAGVHVVLQRGVAVLHRRRLHGLRLGGAAHPVGADAYQSVVQEERRVLHRAVHGVHGHRRRGVQPGGRRVHCKRSRRVAHGLPRVRHHRAGGGVAVHAVLRAQLPARYRA